MPFWKFRSGMKAFSTFIGIQGCLMAKAILLQSKFYTFGFQVCFPGAVLD